METVNASLTSPAPPPPGSGAKPSRRDVIANQIFPQHVDKFVCGREMCIRDRFSGQLSLFAAAVPAKKPAQKHALAKPAAAPQPEASAPAGDSLNPAQQAAVEAEEPAVAVVAGPGTGKTKTLVACIAHLIERRGVKPDEITAVTFTNQAAFFSHLSKNSLANL